jgi:hypothetical protein
MPSQGRELAQILSEFFKKNTDIGLIFSSPIILKTAKYWAGQTNKLPAN